MKTLMAGLSKAKWQFLLNSLEQSLKLTDSEKERLKNSEVAHLIADTVYLSGCKDAERVAVSQLAIYIIATRSKLFAHKKGEQIEERINLLCHFPGGNEEIKKAGKILLSLASIYDHMKDRVDDNEKNKYNPINEKDIDFRQYVTSKLEEFETLDEKTQQAFQKYKNGLAFSYWW